MRLLWRRTQPEEPGTDWQPHYWLLVEEVLVVEVLVEEVLVGSCASLLVFGVHLQRSGST